jgi:hypothetical protein
MRKPTRIRQAVTTKPKAATPNARRFTERFTFGDSKSTSDFSVDIVFASGIQTFGNSKSTCDFSVDMVLASGIQTPKYE